MDEVILSRIRQEAYEQGYQDGKVDGYNLAGKRMSSAKQERKIGKWIKSNESALRPYMCSKCGALFDVDTVLGKLSWQYCPACGAEMEAADD